MLARRPYLKHHQPCSFMLLQQQANLEAPPSKGNASWDMAHEVSLAWPQKFRMSVTVLSGLCIFFAAHQLSASTPQGCCVV